MNTPSGARPSWFYTITHPVSRLILTVSAMVLFLGGIALGVAVPEGRLWFQVPAITILMTWFLLMRHHHHRSLNSQAPRKEA